MTSLADYGIGINPVPPADTGEKYAWVRQDCDWNDAVTLAIQCRKTHPNEPIELWPADGSHRVHVVRVMAD